MTVAANAMEDLWAPVVAGSNAPPVLEPVEHDLDPIATLVSPFVVAHGGLALLATGDAGAYSFVFQCFSEPIGVIAAISEESFHFRQAAQQSPRSDIVADLSSGHEQVERASQAVTDGVQLSVHADLGPAYQAATPPFFTPRLDAVRCAFR